MHRLLFIPGNYFVTTGKCFFDKQLYLILFATDRHDFLHRDAGGPESDMNNINCCGMLF